MLIAICLLVGLLVLTNMSYTDYFEGAKFVYFLLGPATVALAIPLYRQFERVKRSAPLILSSSLVGSLTASMSAVGIVWLLGGSWSARGLAIGTASHGWHGPRIADERSCWRVCRADHGVERAGDIDPAAAAMAGHVLGRLRRNGR